VDFQLATGDSIVGHQRRLSTGHLCVHSHGQGQSPLPPPTGASRGKRATGGHFSDRDVLAYAGLYYLEHFG
jgi:hypothetical protein